MSKKWKLSQLDDIETQLDKEQYRKNSKRKLTREQHLSKEQNYGKS
jgi:hypothetical protein